MARVVEVLGAERGFVLLREEEGQDWQFRTASALDSETMAREDFKISRGVADRVAQEGVSVLTSDALQDARFRDQASVSLYNLRSILCVPIIVSERVLGVIYVDHRLATSAFERSEQHLLEAIANQAAVAIENALLYEKLRRVHESSMAAARKELAETQAQLMHSSKMAAVGQLAAGVAHEINNPLGALSLNISGMKNQLADHAVLPRLNLCEAAINRCKTIVQRLLTFSQKRTRPEQNLDLGEVIEATLQLVDPDLRRCDIRLVQEIEKNLQIQAEGTELSQVFLNLILNARDALLQKPSDRTLWVRARRLPLEGDGKGGGRVSIEVVDNGCGIEADTQARIFEPFFTTKPVGQGVGLGLSICYQLIHQHKGTINVESMPGKGCKFTIELPAVGMPC